MNKVIEFFKEKKTKFVCAAVALSSIYCIIKKVPGISLPTELGSIIGSTLLACLRDALSTSINKIQKTIVDSAKIVVDIKNKDINSIIADGKVVIADAKDDVATEKVIESNINNVVN